MILRNVLFRSLFDLQKKIKQKAFRKAKHKHINIRKQTNKQMNKHEREVHEVRINMIVL